VSAHDEFPWHLARIRAGETIALSDPEEVSDAVDRESLHRYRVRSAVTLPVTCGGRVWGAVSLVSERESRGWPPALLAGLRTIAHVFGSVLSRQHTDRAIRQGLQELGTLRDRLREENAYLRDELRALTGAPALVGNSAAFRRVLEQVRQVAGTDSPVLLVGETGTGKSELAARIHDLSPRRSRALIRVNCASLSMTAIEPAVFGVDKGAYDARDARHVGRIEIADHSTVAFDEIADLPLDAQGRLLRVLTDGHVQPLGSGGPVAVDVRIIAATRVDLLRRAAEGTFRDDLYYQLNVFTIHVPPLRERRDDIPLLVWRFVDEFAERYGKPIDAIDRESMLALQQYAWWGNARELRNVVERAVIVSRDRHLRIPVPAGTAGLDGRSDHLDAIEKEHITAVLARCGWQIPGAGGAAVRLGLSPRVLRGRIRRLGIQVPH
jgi:transcriptional regulator with GAF, ATPase, and Fis domain